MTLGTRQGYDELMHTAWACSDFSVLADDIWVNEDSAAPRCVSNVTVQCVGMPRRSLLTSICICTYLVLLSVPLPGTWYLPLFYKPLKKMVFSPANTHTQKLIWETCLPAGSCPASHSPAMLSSSADIPRIEPHSTCRECKHLQAPHALPKSST